MSSKNTSVNRRQFLKGSMVAGAAVAAGGVVGGLAPATARADTTPEKWDKEVDVVIVGTGHAGLASAIAATDAGAKVVILEKMKKELEGGNSKVSGNMWWTPANASMREQAIQYVTALCYGLTPQDCIEALVDEQIKLNDWLKTSAYRPVPWASSSPNIPSFPARPPSAPGTTAWAERGFGRLFASRWTSARLK